LAFGLLSDGNRLQTLDREGQDGNLNRNGIFGHLL
jgi:hypothetical protein